MWKQSEKKPRGLSEKLMVLNIGFKLLSSIFYGGTPIN